MPWDTSDKISFLGALVAAIVFASAFIFWAIHDYANSVGRTNEVNNWVTVPCVIDGVSIAPRKHLATRQEGIKNAYREAAGQDVLIWRIWYTYEFEGKNYKTGKYNILDGGKELTEEEKKQSRAAIYRGPRGPFAPGDKTVCYVNPGNPSEAVLNRECSDEDLTGAIYKPLLLCGIGVAPLVIFIRRHYTLNGR
jgi:hypothetical protein